MSLPTPTSTGAALVTGASAGIGGAIAHELAQRGHTLILVARRKDRLDALAEELREQHGVRAEVLPCDLGDAGARAALPERVSDLGLEVEVLINNAGFATSGAFHEADLERELEQVRVLVEAVVHLTRAFSPGMVERRRGAILNVASTAGMQPLPYNAGYSAAKSYVLTFSEAVHQELRGHGVTVTALAPGPVETEFWEISGWEVKDGLSLDRAVGPALISPTEAAQAGVKGLESGSRVVVPGLPVRTAMLASRYLPHALKLPALEWMMRRGNQR
jgi:short-subunit dehydrogenase